MNEDDMKAIKKRVEVDYIQWDGSNLIEIEEWASKYIKDYYCRSCGINTTLEIGRLYHPRIYIEVGGYLVHNEEFDCIKKYSQKEFNSNFIKAEE